MTDRTALTTRQAEVLRLHNTGHSPAHIATLLGLSDATIRDHLHRASRKIPPPRPTPPPDPLIGLTALAATAAERSLTTSEAQHLQAGIAALRQARTEISRLRALTADYEQVIRTQRAEILTTRETQ